MPHSPLVRGPRGCSPGHLGTCPGSDRADPDPLPTPSAASTGKPFAGLTRPLKLVHCPQVSSPARGAQALPLEEVEGTA